MVKGLVIPLQGHQGVVGNAVLLGNGCQRALLRDLRCQPRSIALLRMRNVAYPLHITRQYTMRSFT